MRSGRLLTGVLVAASLPIAASFVDRTPWPGADERDGTSVGSFPERASGMSGLQAYVDPDFGFSLAIPAGWQPVVAAETEAQTAVYEPGYAIGFESPRERGDDGFSDYLMVEILPGDESGLFDTDGSLRRAIRVDGRAAWRDELVLAMTGREEVSSAPTRHADGAVELLVRQASFSGLGFTVGLYAIGERSRRTVMGEAFEVMLRTFRLPVEPFDVS